MTLGTALREARGQRGLSRADVGRHINLSPRMIGMIETGDRRLPRDVAPKLARKLDNPWLYMAIGYEATGGVMAVPPLDGNVDLHRSSVRSKAVEELTEALKTLTEAPAVINARTAGDLDEAGRRQVVETLHQVREAVQACMQWVAAVCETYEISPAAVWDGHVCELRAKGLLKKKSAA
jgi:transcriptional regulator with XRE-family HTH domain